jgi:hypothetical protein
MAPDPLSSISLRRNVFRFIWTLQSAVMLVHRLSNETRMCVATLLRWTGKRAHEKIISPCEHNQSRKAKICSTPGRIYYTFSSPFV